MPVVQSVDYPNRRIYLSIDTVGANVQPVDVYKEVRGLRRTVLDHRKFLPLISARGNESVGPTNTPILTVMSAGARIVPYDASHTLTIGGTIVSIDEGLAGPDLFDRAPLSPSTDVDISYQPPQVEVIEVATGGLTSAQAAMLDEIWRMRGLDVNNPVTVTQANEVAGDIALDITGDGVNTSTLTRRP